MECPGAEREQMKGLVSRGVVKDDRPCLIDDPGLFGRVRSRITRGKAYTRLRRRITGRPNRYWREWQRSGAKGNVLRWLRDGGYTFDFAEEVNPEGLGGPDGGGNGSGVHEPLYMPHGSTGQWRSWWSWECWKRLSIDPSL